MAEMTMGSLDSKPVSENNSAVNVGETERWASVVIGGIMLVKGLSNTRSGMGWALAAFGGGMVMRGLSGHCPMYEAIKVDTHTADDQGVHVHAAVTIDRKPEELYAFWRSLENLPHIMSHLETVTEIDPKRSHWVAKAPAGMTVEWDAEIVSETENQAIMWRSTEGAQITNAGSVRFIPVAGERGTEVHVELTYHPPAGAVGMAVAKLFGEEPQHQIEDDLRHFKQFMETGEIATTQGQPSGASLKRQVKSKMLASAESRQMTDKSEKAENEKGITRKSEKSELPSMGKGVEI